MLLKEYGGGGEGGGDNDLETRKCGRELRMCALLFYFYFSFYYLVCVFVQWIENEMTP